MARRRYRQAKENQPLFLRLRALKLILLCRDAATVNLGYNELGYNEVRALTNWVSDFTKSWW